MIVRKIGKQAPTIVTGHAVQEEEPILGSSAQCLAVLEGQGHITDPGQYVSELCKHFTSHDGKLGNTEVTSISRTNGLGIQRRNDRSNVRL